MRKVLVNYQTQLQNYINQNMPNATVGDIFGKKEIIKQDLGILTCNPSLQENYYRGKVFSYN